MQFSKLASLVVTAIFAVSIQTGSHAEAVKLGPLNIIDATSPASLPGQTSAAVYLTIDNQGQTTDRLMKLESPVAQHVMVHQMKMDGSVMKMREIDDLPIKARAKTLLTSGSSYHLMLTGLKRPLTAGEKIVLKMTFEHAGTVEAMVRVSQNAAQKAMSHHH